MAFLPMLKLRLESPNQIQGRWVYEQQKKAAELEKLPKSCTWLPDPGFWPAMIVHGPMRDDLRL